MKKKIAIIGLKGLPAFGGAASVGENIVEQLKDKYNFTVYAISSHTHLETGNYKGIRQIVFNKIPFKKLNTLYYYIISAFHSIFFAKYDLIHLHHRDAAFIILILKIRYKVILTTHGIFRLQEKWKRIKFYFFLQEKWFVKHANVITCVSKNEKRLFKKKLNLDVCYIPNGISKRNISSYEKGSEGNYLFFAAARIIQRKGCDTFLKALKILNHKDDVIIAGDLDQSPDYKRMTENLADGLNINFIGLIKDKKVLLNYIKNAKLFIYPSSLEAMSMMLLEVASVKTPIVCSDIIENKDIFNENEVLFFKSNCVKDLGRQIEWALKNPNSMKTKAENAYKKLINKYTWDKISRQYSEIYDSLLLKN